MLDNVNCLQLLYTISIHILNINSFQEPIMTSPSISRKKRLFLFHRQEILNAALSLFSKKGFHNVSMQEIATASEFAVGTLYNFFPNKNALYHALIEDISMQFYERLNAALDRPGIESDRIKAWLEEKIRLVEDNIEFVRLYFAETIGISFSLKAGLRKDIQSLQRNIIRKLETLFKNGIEKKMSGEFNPYQLAVSLDGMSNALIVEYLDHPGKPFPGADIIFSIFFSRIELKGAHPHD